MLIPKLQIHQYLRTHVYGWSPSAEAENLFSMVERDMEEHPENGVVRSGALRLMTKTLDAGATKPAMLCRVAKWALAARQDELYRKVIKAAISGGPFPPELLDVLSRHFDWEYAREPRDVDWEKWCVWTLFFSFFLLAVNTFLFLFLSFLFFFTPSFSTPRIGC